MINKVTLLPALAVCAAFGATAPAMADPAVGFGFTGVFGGGTPDVGAGLRLFSDDEGDKFAATLGVDYMFMSRQLRPTVGVAWMSDDDYYLGADIGYDMSYGALNFGGGIGYVDTDDDRPAPPPVEEGD